MYVVGTSLQHKFVSNSPPLLFPLHPPQPIPGVQPVVSSSKVPPPVADGAPADEALLVLLASLSILLPPLPVHGRVLLEVVKAKVVRNFLDIRIEQEFLKINK